MKSRRRRWAKTLREMRELARNRQWAHKKGCDRAVAVARHYDVNMLWYGQTVSVQKAAVRQ